MNDHEQRDLQNSAALLRKQLAAINWEDIHRIEKVFKDIKIGKNDKLAKEIASQCETFYKEYMEDILKLMLFEQARTIAAEADTPGKIQFARGTFNGIAFIDEWFKGEYKKSLARFRDSKEDEDFDLTGIGGLLQG